MRTMQIGLGLALAVAVAVAAPAAAGEEEEVALRVARIKAAKNDEQRHGAFCDLEDYWLQTRSKLVAFALIDLLPDPALRAGSATQLGNLGEAGNAAIDPMLKLLNERGAPTVAQYKARCALLSALVRVGADPKELVAPALELVGDNGSRGALNRDDEFWLARRTAVRAVGQGGPAFKPLTPALCDALRDIPPRHLMSFWVAVLETIPRVAPDPKDVLFKVQPYTTNADPDVAAAAKEAVDLLNGVKVVKPKDPDRRPDPDPPADPEKVAAARKLQESIAALKDPAPAKRKEAILTLAGLGVAGRAAEPALVELLKDPDREVRLLAAYALEKLDQAK